MASEGTEAALGVLDELLHEAAAPADTNETLVTEASGIGVEDVDALEMSADDTLQQLDNATLLESEEENPIRLVEPPPETDQSTAATAEDQSMEATATSNDEDQVASDPPQLPATVEEPAMGIEAEETFHEANMLASEAPDVAAESDPVMKDATEEPTETTEAAAPEIAHSTESTELLETEPTESVLLQNDGEEDLPAVETTSSSTTELLPIPDAVSGENLDVVADEDEPMAPPLHEETTAESRNDSSSSDASWENVASPPPPPPPSPHEHITTVLPPPAPQPLFSGSLNPADSLSTTEAEGNESDSDDSDQEDGDEQGEATLPHPPVQLDSAGGDDDEELEVDPVVAEEIRATKPTLPQTHSTKALLDALNQADGVAKQLTADVLQAHASKMDEIALSFDSEPPLEVRAAQVVVPQAHPDSSATMFGIGYQSMKKRGDTHQSGDAERDAYTMAKGPTFHELESEVTLQGDVSLSPAQSQVNDKGHAGEDDEFSEILSSVDGPVSPTRVDEIIQKTLASKMHEDDEQRLLSEMKKATYEEKLRLKEPEASSDATSTKAATDANALTLKELHSIYKRGFGDQEVLLMGDDDDDTKVSTAADETRATAETSKPELSVMGRLLSKHVIAEEAEEDEDEDNESNADRGVTAERSSLDDDDADAVRVESDHLILVDGSDTNHFSESAKRPPAEQAEDEWREIQLLREVSPTPSKAKTEAAAGSSGPRSGGDGTDVGSCSKISYAEAQAYFLESEDVLVHLDHIVAEEKAPSASCFGCLSRQRLAFPDAINQRDRFFCVAATPFDPRNTIHVRMLQTIYRQILNPRGSNRDVPLMGVHWESIGFQGSDPSTDLRGCGVLSLLQLLHLVETQAELARSFHSLSQHAVRHFPMACASINVTLQCLVALRSGALYRECNKRASVFAATNTLHVALTSQLMKEIHTSGDEIPIVMKRVLDHGRLHPDKALELYAATSSPASNHAVQRQQSQSSPRKANAAAGTGRAGRASSSHAPAEFTEIGLHSVDDE